MPKCQKTANGNVGENAGGESEDDVKKFGIIGGALLVLIIGLFIWSLSGASDSKAPTDVKTIDVSPQL